MESLNNLLAFFFCMFTFICTKEEFSIEQLNGNYSKDELEQYVHDQDVDDIFQWVNDAVEHSF